MRIAEAFIESDMTYGDARGLITRLCAGLVIASRDIRKRGANPYPC